MNTPLFKYTSTLHFKCSAFALLFSSWYQRKPSTATCLQHLSEYNGSTDDSTMWMASGTRTSRDIYDKQTEISSPIYFPSQSRLSHRELTDYIGEVRNLVPEIRQRSDKARYTERDTYTQHKGWESTWPINYRGMRENFRTNIHNELQAYVDCYHHTLSKKTPRLEVGEWGSSKCASDMENVLGCGQWVVSAETNENFQPTAITSQKKDTTDLSNREREHQLKWSPWNLRNTESVFPAESFRQPPSYMAPPAYSSPKDGDKLAGIPKVTAEASVEHFENRKVSFTDSTETHHDPSSHYGYYLPKSNQNTESYGSDITTRQHSLKPINTSSVMQYTTINTKPPSPQAELQYQESSHITFPDITQTKQTKLPRRKGCETVFCLVSRMGEVSGLSSSPEEPLKSHVLPLLTDFKPDDKPITTEQTNSPQCNDDSRQNQDAYLQKDKAVRQLDNSLMFGDYGHTPIDQRSSSIKHLGNLIKLELQNKEELRSHVQGNESNCLDQESPMQTDGHEKSIAEKFPLWKEPKYQHHSTGMTEQRNEQSQGINEESKVTNTEDDKNSTNDQQQSLVAIDATCVVVKVELVLLPEKEHVQYVCLTEDSPFLSTREGADVQKQQGSDISSQETPKGNTIDERVESIVEIPHVFPRTSIETHKTISEGHDSSCESHTVDPVKEFEEPPSVAATVDDRQSQENKLMVGQNLSGTTLENNESVEEMFSIMKVEDKTTLQEPEDVFEDFNLEKKSTLEDSRVQTEKNTIHINQSTEQGDGPTLDDSVVKIHQKDASKDLTKDSSTEDNLSDETDDKQVLDFNGSTPFLRKSAENYIREFEDGIHKAVPSTVGSSTLRRSSSSPHLSFTSASNILHGSNVSAAPVVSQIENEALLLLSCTNTETTEDSCSPSVQSSCTSSLPSPSSTPVPDAPSDVLLCTSSPPEHKQKIQHPKSLWDAVSRIRKHTAPDSETEEEETVEFGEHTESVVTDLLHEILNKEEEEKLEDNTLDK
ncbi:hypothetical protein QQF64_003193 [Cirrhinus molitorella]|uniref:Uncharacterized protein n=1 Tax=Cirrhinus molitorella TaxID=172907 RepID=A0ABR3MKH4_9TELE